MRLGEGYLRRRSTRLRTSVTASQNGVQTDPVTNASAWPFLKGPLSPMIVALQAAGVVGQGTWKRLLLPTITNVLLIRCRSVTSKRVSALPWLQVSVPL